MRLTSDKIKRPRLSNCSFQVLSRDSVTVSVDAVVYYRVSNPTMATNNIEDYRYVIEWEMPRLSEPERTQPEFRKV